MSCHSKLFTRGYSSHIRAAYSLKHIIKRWSLVWTLNSILLLHKSFLNQMSGIIIKRIPDYNRNFIEYTPLLASKQHLMAITTFLSTLRSDLPWQTRYVFFRLATGLHIVAIGELNMHTEIIFTNCTYSCNW